MAFYLAFSTRSSSLAFGLTTVVGRSCPAFLITLIFYFSSNSFSFILHTLICICNLKPVVRSFYDFTDGRTAARRLVGKAHVQSFMLVPVCISLWVYVRVVVVAKLVGI